MAVRHGSVDITDYGAIADGSTVCTEAFARAIAAAAARGGGTVYVPPGRYVTGTIMLASHVRLELDAGAVILGSEDLTDYPLVETRWEGAGVLGHAGLIAGDGLEHIAITGHGVIDGQGAAWWARHRAGTLNHARPRLINLLRCRHVRIDGVTLRNAPAWTVNPTFCDDVTIDGVTIANPPDSPNTDGINPDSCRNVRITGCHVDVGDDCITIKAGVEGDATSMPCENIIVTGCTLVHGHGGVVIGSEMSGGVRNVVICNCIFEGTDRGIRIKTRRGRGGIIEDIRVSNVVMRRVACPLTINMYYRCGLAAEHADVAGSREPQTVNSNTPVIRNIHLSHVTAREIEGAASGCLIGLPESPITNVTLDDVYLELTPTLNPDAASPAMTIGPLPATDGEFFVEHARDLRMRNVTLGLRTGPGLRLYHVDGAALDGLITPAVDADRVAIRLEHATHMSIRNCRGGDGKHPIVIDVDASHAPVRADETVRVDYRLRRHAPRRRERFPQAQVQKT